MSIADDNITWPDLDEEITYHESEAKYHMSQYFERKKDADDHLKKHNEHLIYSIELRRKFEKESLNVS